MKVVTFLVLCVLSLMTFSLVSAATAYGSVQANAEVQSGSNNSSSSNGIGSSLSVQISEKREEFRSGSFEVSLGSFLSVREIVKGLLELREGNVTVRTELNLTKVKKDNDGNSLEVTLSNGRNAEIKTMPSTASETAIARLGIKVCNADNNCTIELKEVGSGDNNKVEYDVQAERHSKILGIFNAKMQVDAEVDAETGDVIADHRPWWAFIATSSD